MSNGDDDGHPSASSPRPRYEIGGDLVARDKHEHHHYPEQKPPPPPDLDLQRYLRVLYQKVSTLEIKGIAAQTASNPPIEALYTPLRSARPHPQLGGRTDGQPAEPVLIPELLREHPRLLLEGQPGAGKTTFVRLVACMLARDHLTPRDGVPWRSEHLGLDPAEDPPIPALIALSALLRRLRAAATDLPFDERWILDLLALETCPNDHITDHGDAHEHRRRAWKTLFEEGRALLLLDGLDEVADEQLRAHVLSVVGAAAAAWPSARIVVTSRPISTDEMIRRGFHKAVIDPFGDAEIARFIDLWSSVLHPEAAEQGRDHAQLLRQALGRRPDLRRLAENPVMLTCLCVIHWNRGSLPEGRPRVYRAVFDWMLGSRRKNHEPTNPSASSSPIDSIEFAQDALQRLALRMMRGPDGKEATIDLGDAAVELAELFEPHFPSDSERRRIERARDWLRRECERSHLIQEIEGDHLRFWHLTFQEFAAAWAIAGVTTWREIKPHLADPQWRETLALLGGCLRDISATHANSFVDNLLAHGERGGLLEVAQIIDLLGLILGTLRAYSYKLVLKLDLRRQALAERVMAIFTKEGALQVPVKTRIAAAEVIGQWGDPRLAEGVDNFIEIPGTELRLGKFPVTVGEYGRFIAAGGYQNTRYWDKDGAAWRTKYGRMSPLVWDDQPKHPNRPVVGVSWYEARAYCRWLSERLDGGRRARLPTAAEWEHAATPKTGDYPWGTDQDAGNKQLSDEDLAEQFAIFKLRVGTPCPVGVCPAGAGPHGHLDLAGSVWEWCEDGDGEDWHWLKGGSWTSNNRGELAAAFRNWLWRADDDDSGFGFRVVVAREPD